jgi:hypothetical protein
MRYESCMPPRERPHAENAFNLARRVQQSMHAHLSTQFYLAFPV